MPTKSIKYNKYKHKKSKWVTFGIFKSIHFRDNVYKTLKMTDPTYVDLAKLQINLNTYNNILKNNIQLAKLIYYEKTIC